MPLIGQEMPEEVMAKLEAKSKEVHPDDDSAAKRWVKSQARAWESIECMSFELTPEEIASIKAGAEKKFPGDFLSQDPYIAETAKSYSELSALGQGIDAEIFAKIKTLALKKADNDVLSAVEEIRNQLFAKKATDDFKAPEGMDPEEFAMTKKFLENRFAGDYMALNAELLKRSMGSASSDETVTVAANPADDTNAYTIIGRELFNKSSVRSLDAKPYVGVAVNYMNKLGIIVPFQVFKDGEIMLTTALGDKIEPKNIYASKKYPVLFLEMETLPEGCVPIDIISDENMRGLIAKPLTLAGMYTASVISTYRISVVAVREFDFLLSANTPFSFTTGTLLLDFENRKLVSMMLAETIYPELPNFRDRTAARMAISRAESKRADKKSYIRLDKYEPFEKLDVEKFNAQMEYFEKLINSNLSTMAIYMQNDMSAWRNVGIFKTLVDKFDEPLKSRSDDAKFQREFRNFMQDALRIIKGDIDDKDPKEFYSLIRNEIGFHIEKRRRLISFIEESLKTNNISELIPNDVRRIRSTYKK